MSCAFSLFRPLPLTCFWKHTTQYKTSGVDRQTSGEKLGVTRVVRVLVVCRFFLFVMSINTDWRISWKNSPKAQFFNWIRSYQSSHTFDQKINLLPCQILQTCTCIFVYRITHHARIIFFSKG